MLLDVSRSLGRMIPYGGPKAFLYSPAIAIALTFIGRLYAPLHKVVLLILERKHIKIFFVDRGSCSQIFLKGQLVFFCPVIEF